MVTRREIIHDIPHKEVVLELLSQKLDIIGGFPLWLIGGATHFTDIDCYTYNVDQFIKAREYLLSVGKLSEMTPNTLVFTIGSDLFQLVKPHPKQTELKDILYTTDLSPTACNLVLGNDLYVNVLYPDDVDNRICRVFIDHSWTWYRIKTYEAKGYTVEYDVVVNLVGDS